MIRLSVNVLTSVVILLKRIVLYPFDSVKELSLIRIFQLDTENIFSLACACNWAFLDTAGHPALTERGHEIVALDKQNQNIQYFRIMLTDYIMKICPIWRNRIPYGRAEAVIFMTKDEKSCFCEANLLAEQPSSDIVNWWDEIAYDLRARNDEQYTIIGRKGEQLTINYERERTSVIPKWVSIDSNLSGYDVKSQIDRNDRTPILIEVKTSMEKLGNACCHISSREWLTAQASDSYVFYLWCLNSEVKKLAIILPQLLEPFIPTNNQSGEWESVRIPFICFEDKFLEVI